MGTGGEGRESGTEVLSVLIVEDNPDMRALIRSLAEEVASRVDECDDGEGAVALYPRLRPACVLMDIRMAALDGIAATRAIRRLDPDARIVIVTESDDEADRRAAFAAGATGFLTKEKLLDLPALLRSTADRVRRES